MTTYDMRGFLIDQFKAPKWTAKVLKMSDKQVMAVYFKMVRERR